MKRYFVCYYVWDRLNGIWAPHNEIINQHPLNWFKNRHPDMGDNGDYAKDMNDFPTRLGFWQELGDDYVK